jgi:predicted LPLAT superfamily acyltransferase
VSTAWLGQSERGSRASVGLLVWLTHALGHRLGRALLAPICAYFLAFGPSARRASRAYLGRVLGAPASLSQVFRHLHVFACTLIERIEMLTQGSGRFDIRIHGWSEVAPLMERGRGCLLIGSHLGSVEILRAFGERQQKLAVNLVMHEGNARDMSRWLRRMAPELDERIIAPGRPETLLRVRECLARGEIVAMLGDRHFGGERTMRRDFLGHPARFPVGPMLTAAVLGVPAVAFFCLYRGPFRYDVHFELLAERIELGERRARDAALEPWVERYVRSLEGHTRAAPYNWFNFYDFWQDS